MPARSPQPSARRRRGPGRSLRSRTGAANVAIQVGDRVRVVDEQHGHDYEVGRVYEVVRVYENDDTYILADPDTGRPGAPIFGDEIERASSANSLGWEWLKSVLPAKDVQLLSAFEGLDRLTLREELKDRLVERLPKLKQQLLEETDPDPATDSTKAASEPSD